MGAFWKEFDYKKKYQFKRNKKITQILTHEDFCELTMVFDDLEENIIVKEYYKEFILEAEGVIRKAEEEDFSYVCYWKGHLKVNSQDEVRAKNILQSYKRINPWGGWKVKKNNCLTFKCNSYDDLYLYEKDKKLHYSFGEDLKYVSYKSYEWVLDELKEIVDSLHH